MEVFLSITFIFAMGCLLGWILELFYRRIAHKCWINPGFLKGPYLPLYGFGLALLYAIASIPLDSLINEQWLVIILKIVMVGFAMTLIELIAGLIFIKGMHIQLWDYTDRKFNFMGIICPLFSLIWTALGAIYVLLIHPFIYQAVSWFTDNIYYSFFVGIFFGLLIFDFIVSFDVAVKIKKFADDNKIIIKYEELKEHMKDLAKEAKEKVPFLKPFANLPKLISSAISPTAKFLSKLKNKKIKKK